MERIGCMDERFRTGKCFGGFLERLEGRLSVAGRPAISLPGLRER